MVAKKTKKRVSKNMINKEDHSKLYSVLTYIIFIVGLVWYLVDDQIKKNEFARFHFKQSLILVIGYVVFNIAAGIISIGIINWVVDIAFLVMVVLGVINVINDEEKELPFIGQYAKKFKF